MSSDNVEIVTRVITFFFPYDSKVEEYEYSQWYPGDPRDFSDGHPHGHETWGHGEKTDWGNGHKGEDDWKYENRRTTVGWEVPTLPVTPSTVPATTINPSDIPSPTSDSLLLIILGVYLFLLILAFISNVLLANVLKKYRWGMKLALLFHLCLAGSLLCITNTLHFIASGFHLLKRQKNSSFVLQGFAIIAWIDHIISFVLLIFVMYLAICCFNFYWNNKTRQTVWGRSYVLYAVVSTYILAFLLAGFTAYFQCDVHIQKDQCIYVLCATSNIFSSLFTELLTRVRIVIPIIILLLILLSVRVGSSKVRRESVMNIEGADIHGDRELLLMCSLVFIIYEITILIPEILILFCISPLLSVCSWHFGVLLSTMATPIAVIGISRNTRDRMILLYSCKGKSKALPHGSYSHTANKYKDMTATTTTSDDHTKRRQSGVSLFTQEFSSTSNDSTNRKLSTINEEIVPRHDNIVQQPKVETIPEEKPSFFSFGRHNNNKQPNVIRVQSADQVVSQNRRESRSIFDVPVGETPAYNDGQRRRMSHNDVTPHFENHSYHNNNRFASIVNNRMNRITNMHLPQHIFVHHIHDNKVKPVQLAVQDLNN